jgi:hypothetical protein
MVIPLAMPTSNKQLTIGELVELVLVTGLPVEPVAGLDVVPFGPAVGRDATRATL